MHDLPFTQDSPFDPDWTVPTADLLLEIIQERGLYAARARHMRAMDRVLDGDVVTRSMAKSLERGTGVSARFWLSFDRHYRADLTAGKKAT